MKPEDRFSKLSFVGQGKTIEGVLRHAVGQALLMHKRAGNSIASIHKGRVVLIPAEEIKIPTEALTNETSRHTKLS